MTSWKKQMRKYRKLLNESFSKLIYKKKSAFTIFTKLELIPTAMKLKKNGKV